MPIKARNYITVYKVVKRRKHCTSIKKYKTPVMNTPIQLYKEYNAIGPNISKYTTIIKPMGILNQIQNPHGMLVYKVEKGYIHCLTDIEQAKYWLRKNYHLFPHNKKQPFKWGIIKCIIEPGTLYYKSYDGSQICTKSLKTYEVVLKG